MELIKFKLQNYKRYKDTDWISVGCLTAFVGKNEAGKSALFQGLAKLNPSDKTTYDEFRELPRRLLTDLRGKHLPVCSAVFKLSKEDLRRAREICADWEDDLVMMTKYYNNKTLAFFSESDKQIDRKLSKYFISKMPHFLYFDNYDVLDSAINIPDYLNKLKNEPKNRKLRVQTCLFRHVKLSAEELKDLDPSSANVTDDQGQLLAAQRSALCHAAQASMTDKFSAWWFQRRHQFHYKVDGKYFRIEISDDIDPSPIVLEERSMGMRYFFSFYLIFLVEAETTNKNSIILLDEPGLHYHGSMQTQLITFFRTLSKKNQILYTTHSPFLVDSANLDSIKTVFEDKETGFSRVAETQNWPRDQDALFPIRVGWWYDVLNSYITKKTHLVLEGQSDVEIFNAMNNVLEKQSKNSLHSDILCVPGGGHKTSMLISLLRASDVNIILFQDGDDAGTNRAKNIKKEYKIPYITTSNFCNIQNSSIEDLFPPEFYLCAVTKAYPDLTISMNDIDPDKPILDSLKDKFNNSEEFDKMKVVKCIIDNIDDVPEKSITTFAQIFDQINQLNDDI